MRLLSRRDPPRTSEQSKGRRGRHARVTRARHRVGTDACRSVHVHTYKKKKIFGTRTTNLSAVVRSLTPVRAICWCVCGGEPRVWRAMRDRALTVYACAWLLESAGTIGLWQPKTLPHRRQPSSGRTRTLQATKLW